MAIEIGVNGAIGAIGMNVVLELVQEEQKYYGQNYYGLELVAANDVLGARAFIEKFNCLALRKNLDLKAEFGRENEISVGNSRFRFFNEEKASKIPWREEGVKIVEECSGYYTGQEGKGDPRDHFRGGAERIIVSAPTKGEDITLVMGINHEKYDKNEHRYISNASCTTKALAMPLKALIDSGVYIDAVEMDTTHATTAKQDVLKTLNNLLLATTEAAKDTARVIPSLEGKLGGFALRAPIENGSFVNLYLTAAYDGDLDKEKVNDILATSAVGGFRMRICMFGDEYCRRMSFDYTEDLTKISLKDNVIGRRESAVIIGAATDVIPLSFKSDKGKTYLVRIVSGYDNELAPAVEQILLTSYIANESGY